MHKLVFAPWLLALVVLTGASAADQPVDRQALALVKSYNSRNFGNPGWRRVHLDLKSGETVTRSFDVVNLWQRSGEVVRTLFVLQRPESLQGTDYLLVEDPYDPLGMKVFLHLPAGRRGVLSIQPSRFGEGLLGSDFGYRDLRMRLPVAGYGFRMAGRQMLGQRNVRVVEVVPVATEAREVSSWARARLYFLESAPLLAGADYFSAPADRTPAKSLRVLDFRQVDGAWTETRMVMNGADGHSSVLTLEDFKPRLTGIDPALFQPETLPAAREKLAGRVAGGWRRSAERGHR